MAGDRGQRRSLVASIGATSVDAVLIGAALIFTASISASQAAGPKLAVPAIVPGPRQMSAEEVVLVENPTLGIQGAVILVDETENHVRTYKRDNEITHHRRIKILSGSGADLADIAIPFAKKQITQWWGVTIRPDGKVLDLPQEALLETLVAKYKRLKYRETRGALSGVIAGSVIDYGWTASTDRVLEPGWVQIQDDYRVISWRYHWVVNVGSIGWAANEGANRLGIKYVTGDGEFLLSAANVPPFKSEPFGVCEEEMRGAVKLHYADFNSPSIGAFWASSAAAISTHLADWSSSNLKLESALAGVDFGGKTGPLERLEVIYNWMQRNFRNLSLLSREEQEDVNWSNEKLLEGTAKSAIELRQGGEIQLAMLLYGFAVREKLRPSFVLIPNRTERFFNSALRELTQFDLSLVSVQDEKGQTIYLAPCRGLPFGQVPWWGSRVKGFSIRPDGTFSFETIPGAEAKDNRWDVKGTIEFLPHGTVSARWQRSETGQAGYQQRIDYLSRSPEDRIDLLNKLCGESSSLGVTKAAYSSAETALDKRPQLICEAELLEADAATDAGRAASRIEIAIGGPWFTSLPALVPGIRNQPVLFNFPFVEHSEIEYIAPPGFRPGTPPQGVSFDSNVGRIDLHFERSDKGFKLTRDLVLKDSVFNPGLYSNVIQFMSEVRQDDLLYLVFKNDQAASR